MQIITSSPLHFSGNKKTRLPIRARHLGMAVVNTAMVLALPYAGNKMDDSGLTTRIIGWSDTLTTAINSGHNHTPGLPVRKPVSAEVGEELLKPVTLHSKPPVISSKPRITGMGHVLLCGSLHFLINALKRLKHSLLPPEK